MAHVESASEFKRRRTFELLDLGETPATIARYLGVCRNSIYEWRNSKRNGKQPCSKRQSGRPRLIASEELRELEELLLQGSVAHGWINEMWTTHRVKDILCRHFNIKVSRTTAWRILRHSLRWSPQQPTVKLVERDEEAIERWQTHEFDRIKAQADKRGAYLVFVDEAGFMLMPSMRKTFAPIGQTPIARVSNPHGRISTACALTFSPERRHANLMFRLLPDNANFTGHTVCQFLGQIARRLRSPFTVIWDSIRIHLAQPVREFKKRNRHIVFEMFPKYAPELNPADGVWAYTKYARLANYTPQSLAELRTQVESELLALSQRPNVLRGFVHKTPLRLD